MAAEAERYVERLWSVARREAARLKRNGFHGVAVSGSLARGDARRGSDVDLWAIGPKSGRVEGSVGGVPVTVFYSRPEELKSLAWLARWDTEHLVVLHDTRGALKQMLRHAERNAPRIRAWIERQTREALVEAEKTSRDGVGTERVLAKRAVAWIRFAHAVWQATGVRVAKWKHAEQLLGAVERRRLKRALALKLPARGALIRQVQAAPAAIAALFEAPRSAFPPWSATQSHLREGSVEEAVLKLRSDVDNWLAWPLRERLGPRLEVAVWLDARAPALARLFRVAHALPRVAAGRRRAARGVR